MTTFTLIAALLSLALTLAVVWANPHRFSNQAFALVSLVQTAWLACLYRAQQIGSQTAENVGESEAWLRANAAVISFAPATIWLLKNAITSREDKRKAIVGSIPVFAISVVSVFLCYSDSFIFRDPASIWQRGTAYYIHSFLGLAVYGLCIIQVCGQMRAQTGIRRVELQFLALNTGGAAFLIGALIALGNYLQVRELIRVGVFLAFAASALTAWALLFHRVFNAQEMLLRLGRPLSFALVLSGGIYAMWRTTSSFLADPFGLLVSIGLCSPIAVWLDRKSRAWFDAGGERKLAQMRRAAIDLARTELQTDKLIRRFEALLCAEFQTRSADVLFDCGGTYESPALPLAKDRAAFGALCELGWATPESLLRRRSNPSLDDLQQFLGSNDLGVVVSVPRSSPTPSLLVALRTRIDDWPFTYPEVERLQNLALLIDNLLTRSRLAAQAALQARMEHVAMMSRGLAHDLKNLVTPVSSFLVHTDGRFPANSAEAEVHIAARRSMRIMTDYLREALFFAERLEPRFEGVDLENICATACEVTALRAARRNVVVATAFAYSEPFTADGVLIQRMLANLLSNAIDASAPGQTVSLTTSSRSAGWVRLQVWDNGCGITPENIARVFDPYFTTKEFGDELRGFGLGLTICQKIVLLHRGTISVKSEPGCGTTFTVDLPTDQTPPSAAKIPAALSTSIDFLQ